MIIQPYTAAQAHAQAQIGDDEPLHLECEACHKTMEIMPTDDVMTYAIQSDTCTEPEWILCSVDCCIAYAKVNGMVLDAQR